MPQDGDIQVYQPLLGGDTYDKNFKNKEQFSRRNWGKEKKGTKGKKKEEK